MKFLSADWFSAAYESFKSVTKKIIALGISSVIAVLVFEAGLRIYNPIESRVRGNRIVLPANRLYDFENTTIDGVGDRVVHTKNALGFRGENIPAGGLGDRLSIITVGGSTTECFLLSDGMDWPALLQTKLAQSFDSVWVNNAGLDGHSTYGHTVLLTDYLAELRPKVLLFLVGLNDLGRLDGSEHTAAQIQGGVQFGSIEGFFKSLAAYSETASVGVTFYRYLRARWQGLPHRSIDVRELEVLDPIRAVPHDVTEREMNSYVLGFRARLRKLIRVSREAGIDPVFVTQPALYGPGGDELTGVDLGRMDVGGESGFLRWHRLQLYNRATEEIGRTEGVLTIPLASELDKSTRYYYDFVHFTNAGSERVADIIYRHLKPYIEKRHSQFGTISSSANGP